MACSGTTLTLTLLFAVLATAACAGEKPVVSKDAAASTATGKNKRGLLGLTGYGYGYTAPFAVALAPQLAAAPSYYPGHLVAAKPAVVAASPGFATSPGFAAPAYLNHLVAAPAKPAVVAAAAPAYLGALLAAAAKPAVVAAPAYYPGHLAAPSYAAAYPIHTYAPSPLGALAKPAFAIGYGYLG